VNPLFTGSGNVTEFDMDRMIPERDEERKDLKTIGSEG
jgi:hypothetical protein